MPYFQTTITENPVNSALNGTLVELLGVRGAQLFNSLDVNKDGYITDKEFGPVVETLTGEVC